MQMKVSNLSTVAAVALFLAAANSTVRLAGATLSPCTSLKDTSSADVLAANDRIIVQALHAPEISSQPYRIDSTGSLTLPLAGRLQAAGLTVHQFEDEVASSLKPYILDPQVTVSVAEFKGQPVSVDGAIKNPGVYQLEGNKTLLEMLSLSGGVTPEAGDAVKIARRARWTPMQLPGAHSDAAGEFSVGEISLRALMDARTPAANIAVCPGDVITVPRARLVYVIGEVHKPGGFLLRDGKSTSVVEALSMAEGLLRTAAPGSARILREQPNHSERLEIPVNLGTVLKGKGGNVELEPSDILLVPNSTSKTVLYRGAEASLQMLTGVVIWR